VFLSRVKTRAGRLTAARFIENVSGRRVDVDRGEPQLSIAADPRFDQVASIIILSHPDGVPIDDHPIAIALSAYVCRRTIELRIREATVIDGGLEHIAPEDIQELSLDPTAIHIGPWIDVHPAAISVAAIDLYSIRRVQPPLIQVGCTWTIAAVGLD
jgi:hypothetical protein